MRGSWIFTLCLTLASGVACRPANTSASNDSAAASATAPASTGPVRPEHPEYLEVTVPAGTTLQLRLETPVASDRSHVEEEVHARLRRAVVVEGKDVVPEGSAVSGTVAHVERSGRVKGRARIALRFNTLEVGQQRYEIQTGLMQVTAPGTKKKDAEKIGIPAAAGAVIGALAGGGKGAAIGAGVGGGAGTAYVLSTRGEEVRLGHGAALSITLAMPLHIRIAANSTGDERHGQKL